MSPRVTLYTKPGCHLCEDAEVVIERVCADTGTSYDVVDISDSTELMTAYGEQIPVTFVDGRKVLNVKKVGPTGRVSIKLPRNAKIGKHKIRATFLGNATTLGSRSAKVTVKVVRR